MESAAKERQELGERIASRYDTLEALRRPWEPLWQDIATYVMPRRSPGMGGTVGYPSTAAAATLFDTTAVQANLTLANGQLAWMSPLESPWFGYDPGSTKDDDAKRWLSEVTRVSQSKLARSNFYTSVHEFYLDRGAFGTACLYVEISRKRNGKRVLNTQCWPVGTFVVDEDADGEVDTVIRTFKLTARQAAQKFGLDNLSPKVRKQAQDPKQWDQKADYLHAIYPREDAERDASKADAANMPIAAVYVEKDCKHVCLTGGYPEMPVFVSRFLEWGTGLGSLYGWCPAFVALPEARQLNYFAMWADALAEKISDPPWLAPEDLEGEIDVNARGVTYFSRELASANALPRPMVADVGRMNELMERIKDRKQAINDAFHVDLFQMFSQIQKQMTAREVAERSSEKLIQFSPTFSRLTNELFNPMLERIFSLLLLNGDFGPLENIPQALLKPVPGNEGMVELPSPDVAYSSRIALSLRALPSIGYQRTLERLSMVSQMSPDVLDNYDFDAAERSAALTDGVPVEFLRPIDERDKLREARAQAQAQQAQQQQAMMAAEAAAKVGRIPGDSPVGQAIQQAAGGQMAA